MSRLRRRALLGGAAGGSLVLATSGHASAAGSVQNIFSAATAWRVTAAERDMLYAQGFNIARDRLNEALGERDAGRRSKPLAIISDIDDTVLSTNDYWTMLISAGKQAFDDALWDEWVRANGPTATPGAVAFARYAQRKGVPIFYVSSRDQGPDTQQIGVANLAHVGLPYADDEHVTMLRESSDKEPTQQAIAKDYDVVVYLGDNLNDFRRRYYVDSVEERRDLAAEDAARFGRKYVLFPNNTDGHWLKAIFKESEPADTPRYRARMLKAARGRVH